MGYKALRWPPQPRNKWWGAGLVIQLVTLLRLINEWIDKGNRKIYLSLPSRIHKHICEDASKSNHCLFLCTHY